MKRRPANSRPLQYRPDPAGAALQLLKVEVQLLLVAIDQLIEQLRRRPRTVGELIGGAWPE